MGKNSNRKQSKGDLESDEKRREVQPPNISMAHIHGPCKIMADGGMAAWVTLR